MKSSITLIFNSILLSGGLCLFSCTDGCPGSSSIVESTACGFNCTVENRATVTQSRSDIPLYKGSSHGMAVCIHPHDRQSSRSSGGEFDWPQQTDGEEQIAVYIVKDPVQDGSITFNAALSNMAYNPFTRRIRPFQQWCSLDELTDSYIDVDEFIQQQLFVEEGAHTLSFYGYTIRPTDNHGVSGGLNYIPKSIIPKIDASNLTSPLLSYTFMQTGQDDTTIAYHDVMYCNGETKGNTVTGRFGNLFIGPRESVQMHFRHAFTRLNITVNRGNYTGSGVVSSIAVRGTHVYDEGKVNIVTGEVIPNTDSQLTGGKSIVRRFGTDGTGTLTVSDSSPLRTEIIINPVSLPQDIPAGSFDIVCTIDGIDYVCPVSGIDFLSGYEYDVELTFDSPGKTVIDCWYGLGSLTIMNGKESQVIKSYGQHVVTGGSQIVPIPADGYVLSRVTRNGTAVQPVDGAYPLVMAGEGQNVTYNIVFVPSQDWYVNPSDMNVHLHSLMNERYNGRSGQIVSSEPWVQNLSVGWCDLSGNGHDGRLNSFYMAGFIENPVDDDLPHIDDSGTAWQTPHDYYRSFSYSGWDGKGLKFDGLDDVVSFTSDFGGPFTVEIYICIENVQRGMCPRLTAEPLSTSHAYPSFFLYGIGTGSNLNLFSPQDEEGRYYRYAGLYGMGIDVHPWRIFPDGNNIMQLDFVFDGSQVQLYVNGQTVVNGFENKPVQPTELDNELTGFISSIGNRLKDNTRGLNATYYNYILYDRVLSTDEMLENLRVNRLRFGSFKRDMPGN